MKTIIAGSRSIYDPRIVLDVIEEAKKLGLIVYVHQLK